MLFFLTKVTSVLISPTGFLALLGGFGLIQLWRGRWRQGRALLTLSAVLVVLMPVVANIALGVLEDRFPAKPNLPSRIDGIIILGGMVDPTLSEAHDQAAIKEGAERLFEGIRLAKQHPEAKVVFTGGSGIFAHSKPSEADYAVPLLVDMGVSLDRILVEDRSLDTYENAIYSQTLAQPRLGQTWVLVTSARHIPRSVGVFRRIGWPVIAYPVDFQTLSGHWSARMASLRFMRATLLQQAAHEWQGLLFYRLTGRTDSLFPAP